MDVSVMCTTLMQEKNLLEPELQPFCNMHVYVAVDVHFPL